MQTKLDLSAASGPEVALPCSAGWPRTTQSLTYLVLRVSNQSASDTAGCRHARLRFETVMDDRDIPRACTTPLLGHDHAVRLAVAWANQQADALGEQVSVFVPLRKNLDGNITAVKALVKSGVRIAVARGGMPLPGVVIALWPRGDMLNRIEDSPETAAVVAVTWSPSDTAGWADKYGAEPLS